ALPGPHPAPSRVPVGNPGQVLDPGEADAAQAARCAQPVDEAEIGVVMQLERDDGAHLRPAHRVPDPDELPRVETGRLLEDEVLGGAPADPADPDAEDAVAASLHSVTRWHELPSEGNTIPGRLGLKALESRSLWLGIHGALLAQLHRWTFRDSREAFMIMTGWNRMGLALIIGALSLGMSAPVSALQEGQKQDEQGKKQKKQDQPQHQQQQDRQGQQAQQP